jgi:hypothetical protein
MASPRNISAKYSGERRRDQHQRQYAEGAGDEGGDGGNAERRAGAAALRHRVAVEASDHRG